MLDDMLIMTPGDKIEGRDVATGRVSWTFDASDFRDYTPPEEQLGATGDYVVAAAPNSDAEGDDPSGDSLLIFNGRTGTVLWQLASGPYGAELPTPFLRYLGVGLGRVFIRLPAVGVVRALDVLDGRQKWAVAMPAGCAYEAGDADEWAVALLMRCGRHSRLRVLEPLTGRLLWDREVFPLGNALINLTGGAIGLESDNAFTVYDVNGEQLYARTGDLMCTCMLAATGMGLLVVRQSNRSDTETMVTDVVNRRTGRIIVVSGQAGDLASAEAIEGRLYGWRRLGEDLRAFIVVMIDPATGRQTPVATYPGQLGLFHLGRHELLFNAPAPDEDTSVMVVHRLTPSRDLGAVSRGGVERGRWPDACALLPPSVLAAEFPGAGYTSRPRPAPPELGLDTPAGCDLMPDDDEHPVLTLSILWVGRTSNEAEAVLEAVTGSLDATPDQLIRHKPDVRLYVDKYLGTVVARAGDTVMRLDGVDDREAAVRLALRMARSRETAE
ncbi:PQQ-binding-like beta-propeller repeat protein [Nonomuraea sp. NPDC048881]|uniref:outer membrane protein assembly factor BamB family protein n=1 Tax=Nonomuraea sp. NPDC048881 TaxID=3155030 RepID=UPI0033EE4CD3